MQWTQWTKMCRRQRLHRSQKVSPGLSDLGPLLGRSVKFLKQFPPPADWGLLVVAPEQKPEPTLRERVYFEGGRRTEQAILNLHRQCEEIHDLCDPNHYSRATESLKLVARAETDAKLGHQSAGGKKTKPDG